MARIISTIIKVALGTLLIYIGVNASKFFYYYDRIAHHEWYILPCLILIAAGGRILWRAVRPRDLSMREQVTESPPEPPRHRR